MGALLSVCGLGQMACCAASSACSCLSCCSMISGARVMYSILLLLVTITGWIMTVPNVSTWLKDHVPFCWHSATPPTFNQNIKNIFGNLSQLLQNVSKTTEETDATVCDKFTGYLAVYRLMFATCLFFFFFAVIMLGANKSRRDPRKQLHHGFWPVKLLLLVGAIVGCFFIPATSAFADVWKYFGLIGAFLFLIIQFFIVAIFADDWAEAWVSEMESSDSNWHYIGLLGATILNYALTITAIVLFFVYYGGNGCALHNFFISLHLFTVIILSIVAILPKVQEYLPRSGLLQASVVSLYLSYLTWSALNTSPHTSCKPIIWGHPTDTSLDLQSFISLAICLAAVIYSSIRLSSQAQFERITGVSNLHDDASVSSNTHLTGGDSSGDEEEDNSNWSYFYLIFALGTLYLMMTLTNWYSPTETYQSFGVSTSALWIKISSVWLCAGLYIWTLVAPILLHDYRDF